MRLGKSKQRQFWKRHWEVIKVPQNAIALVLGAAILVGLIRLYEGALAAFWQYAAIIIATASAIFAGISAIIASESLNLTRAAVTPLVCFRGTIDLGNMSPSEKEEGIQNLDFPITNTGTTRADVFEVRIEPFREDEQVELDNSSKKYETVTIPPETFLLFPNQTYHAIIGLHPEKENEMRLFRDLLDGIIKLRVTISYEGLGREYKTIQTFAYNKSSLSEDERKLHGFITEPQKCVSVT